MGGNGKRPALGRVFSDARAEDHDAGQADDAAHGMNDAGAGEVDGPVAEAPVHAHLGQPSAAPNPMGVDAERQRDPKSVQAEVFPTPSFGHRAGGDGGRNVHEAPS